MRPQRLHLSCAAKSAPPATQGQRDAAIRQDVFDVIATARSKAQPAPSIDAAKPEVRLEYTEALNVKGSYSEACFYTAGVYELSFFLSAYLCTQ